MNKHFLFLFLISNSLCSPSRILSKIKFGEVYCSLAASGATWALYTDYKNDSLKGESLSTRLATNASLGAIVGTSAPVWFPVLMVYTGIEKFQQITEKKS